MYNSKLKQETFKKTARINDSSFISYCPLSSDERIVPFINGQSVSIKRASDRQEGRFAKLTNLYFRNNHLSKEHAKIRYDREQGFYIQDANSTFGTVLNNEKVLIPGVEHLLNTNDTVGLIMSKTSLQIKKITEEFISANSTDKDIRSIPISEFDNPTIVINFRIDIKDSILKLIPIERGGDQVANYTKADKEPVLVASTDSTDRVNEIPDDSESSSDEVEVVDIGIVSNTVTENDNSCLNGHNSDDEIIVIDVSDEDLEDHLVSEKPSHLEDNEITKSDHLKNTETQGSSVGALSPTDRIESPVSKMIVEVPSSEHEVDDSGINVNTKRNWKGNNSNEISHNCSSGEFSESEISSISSSDDFSDSDIVDEIKNRQDEISILCDESELTKGEFGEYDQSDGDNNDRRSNEQLDTFCYKSRKDDHDSKYYSLLEKCDHDHSDFESELDVESTLFGSNCDKIDDIEIPEDNKLVRTGSQEFGDDYDETMSLDQSRSGCSSRKRRYEEIDNLEDLEHHTSIEYSDCESTNQPPRKKHASIESKWKTFTKEVGKGLFYVFATIVALGVYGSSIANEES